MKKNIKEAIEYCERKIGLYDIKGDISFIRGLFHLKQIKYDKAFSDFVQVEKKGFYYNNKYGTSYYMDIARICNSAINSANISFKKDGYKNEEIEKRESIINEEIKNCDRYINSYPEDPEVYFIRGSFSFKMGYYSDAWSDYKKAIELGYHKPQIFLYRGMLNQEFKDEERYIFDCFQYLKLITDPHYIPKDK